MITEFVKIIRKYLSAYNSSNNFFKSTSGTLYYQKAFLRASLSMNDFALIDIYK
jgi:hypothetical protein